MSAELQQRIERLEKERWIYLGLGALAVLAGLLGALLGSGITGKSGSTLRGQNLELRSVAGEESLVMRDAGGRPMFAVGVGKDGLPHMHFYDHKGQKPRQSLGFASGDDPEIRMASDKGDLLVQLIAKDSETTQLTFHDGQVRRASVGLIEGKPKLEIYDLTGNRPTYTVPPLALPVAPKPVAPPARPGAAPAKGK